MTDRTGFDISQPLAPITGYDVCAFYLGGMTPHQWSVREIEEQPARWRWPIWVLDPARDAITQAWECAYELRRVDCPKRCAVMLDLETLVVPHMVDAFADTLHRAGQLTTPYGSTSTLFQNPVRAGYAVATLDGKDQMYDHPHVIGTQWGQATVGTAPAQKVDQWLISPGLPLWDAHPPKPPTPAWALQVAKGLQGIGTSASDLASLVIRNAR